MGRVVDRDRLLWEHALAVTKNNATAHCNLGMYYYDHGLTDVARAELETAKGQPAVGEAASAIKAVAVARARARFRVASHR